MKRMIKRRSFIVGMFFLTIIILGLTQITKISNAQSQYNKESGILTAPIYFEISEYSEDSDSEENITSIELSLPSSNWNLTDLQVNFTDIEFNQETIDIEKYGIFTRSLGYEYYEELAVQINITDPTIIYGVEIYGSTRNPQNDDVIVQVRGYDSINNAPNDTVYASTTINMTENEYNWYYQGFLKPAPLEKGNYSLVINATHIHSAPMKLTEYKWFYNDSTYLDPAMNPDLYVSYCDDGVWSTGKRNEPFLYKLDQKLNFSFKPNDINMQAEINGDYHPVENGIDPIKGNLSIQDVNYSSPTETLSISIKNNKSSSLLFNATYNYNLHNLFISEGTVSIRESFNNTWTLNPIISRQSNDYSIKFDYPDSWFNLTVFNSSGILTETVDYTNDGDAIFIPNNTIGFDTDWTITANSKKVDFNSYPQLSQYSPLQDIIFEVNPPPSGGNLTFILLDSVGNLKLNQTIQVDSTTEEFSYTIPQNPFEGIWRALTFWNNQTHAGLEINEIRIVVSDGGSEDDKDETTIVTGIDPQLIYITILYIAIGSVASLTSYKVIKNQKRKKEQHRQKIFNKYMDLLNLDYIMIVDKNSGLNVYEQVLAGKERDVSLISGFLEAIRSFGIELSGSEDESQAIRLQYQNMNIIMNDFKNFRILNIMKEPPSQDFLDSLRPLSHDIDTYYGKSLKDFDGRVTKFKGIKDLLDTHLQTSLIYPLKVVKSKELKLDSAEKALVNKAQNIMKKNNADHFFVSYLMGAGKEFNVKNAEIILKLIQKKVFQPIS